MTRYDALKLLHVLGAIAWVGGGLGLLVLSRQFVRAQDYEGLMAVGRQGQSLGMRLFMPASLVTLASGVALVATEAALRFTDLWILIGFGGIVASGIAQMTVAERAGRRFTDLMAEHGAGHPDLAAAARSVTVGNALDVGLLVVVVWAMVAKPSL
ncbi:MAG TPA: DUF2269 family protein [Egibacteraceae bacterium]|nr:DUF2269 family protein [Egibacteraceae bacterium]